MSFRDSLLPGLEAARAIAGSLGLRSYRIWFQTTINTNPDRWKGVGTPDNDEIELTPAGQPPKIVQVSAEEIFSSGGLFKSQDLKVGPLTPSLLDDATDINPALQKGLALRFRVTGPDLPTSGCLYNLVSTESTALHTYLIIRKK